MNQANITLEDERSLSILDQEQHDGRVNAESENGKGSCFTFTLPLPQEEWL